MLKPVIQWTLASTVLGLIGCTGDITEGDEGNTPPPVLFSMSPNERSVGEPIDFDGSNFVSTDEGHTIMWFRGTFEANESGNEYPVDFEMYPTYRNTGRATVSYFGPYQVPFSPTGDETGVFRGTVTPITVLTDTKRIKKKIVGASITTTLTVKPSIIIRDFQPVGAKDGVGCPEPVKRVIDDLSYKITAEAIGFTPVSFEYGKKDTDTGDQIYPLVAANGKKSTFGEDGSFFFKKVPDEDLRYRATLQVKSVDAQGNQYRNVFVIGVHRAIEQIDWGTDYLKYAEEPVEASDCEIGTTLGGNFRRDISQTLEKRREVSAHYDQGLTEEYSVSGTTSREERFSRNISSTNGVDGNASYHYDNMEGSNWSAGGGGGVQLGIFNANGHAEYGRSRSRTEGQQIGMGVHSSTTVSTDSSVATTESWTTTMGRTKNVNWGEGTSSSTSASETFGTSIDRQIAPGATVELYRQAVQYVQPGVIVAYNYCGDPEILAEIEDPSWKFYQELAEHYGDCDPPPVPKKMEEPGCKVDSCEGF